MLGKSLNRDSTTVFRDQFRFMSGGNETGNNGLVPQPPKFPHYKEIKSRQASFHGQRVAIDAKEAAIAGLFHTGEGDCLSCYQCGVVLKNWERGDNPMKEHTSHSLECPLVQVMGKEYVKQACRTVEKVSPEELYNRCAILRCERDKVVVDNAELNRQLEDTNRQLEDAKLLISQLTDENERLKAVHPIQITEQRLVGDVDMLDNSPHRNWRPRGNNILQETRNPSDKTVPKRVDIAIIGPTGVLANTEGVAVTAPTDGPTGVLANTEGVAVTAPTDGPTGALADTQALLVGPTDDHMEVEGAVGETRDDPAIQSCIEVGYSRQAVLKAVVWLKKEGKTIFHAADICELLLEMEENGENIKDVANEERRDTDPNLTYPKLSFDSLCQSSQRH